MAGSPAGVGSRTEPAGDRCGWRSLAGSLGNATRCGMFCVPPGRVAPAPALAGGGCVELHAISATQGLDLHTGDGIVAAPYWDVESTSWLRWCVASAELVEITGSPTNVRG